MTDDKILLKALKKSGVYEFDIDKYNGLSCDGHILWLNQYGEREVEEHYFYYIFSHSFAKAFWGGEQIVNPEHFDHMLAKWQYHLQVMVLQEEPLQYLVKFLDEEKNK